MLLRHGNILFGGKELGRIAYEAAIGAYDFSRVALVMHESERVALRPQDAYVLPDMGRNFFRGISRCRLPLKDGKSLLDDGLADYLIIAGDLPFLKPEHVKMFFDEVHTYQSANIFLPIIPRESNERAYPKRVRGYIGLQEGEFVLGSIAYLSQNTMQSKRFSEMIDLYDKYNSKFYLIHELVNQFGLIATLEMNQRIAHLLESLHIANGSSKVSLARFETHISEYFGYSGASSVKLVPFNSPEIAYDIDTAEDFREAERLNQSM